MNRYFARKFWRNLKLGVALCIMLPLVASGIDVINAQGEVASDDGQKILLPLVIGASQADEAVIDGNDFTYPNDHDDEYWAELAKDEEPLIVTDEMVRAAAANNVGGSWGPIIDWPHIPVSVANLPDGKLLTFSGGERLSWGSANRTYSAVWDPETGDFDEGRSDDHNMFCGEMVSLDDGRVFVNGGRQTVVFTSIWDPAQNRWTRTNNMSSARWYATSVLLPDNRVFTAAGRNNRYPEVWTDGSGWRRLTGADIQDGILDYGANTDGAGMLALMHLDPRGKVLHYGATPVMHSIDPNGNGNITSLGNSNFGWYPEQNVAIMFDENRILVAGGSTNGGNTSVKNAAILDMSNPQPQITGTDSMHHARQFGYGVMLPTGDVLVVGGSRTGSKFSDSNAVLTPEMWNPQTGNWTELNNMSVPRTYHSTAILLPDGRVFSGGGGYESSGSSANDSTNHPDAQIFTPPYLYNFSGSLAARPRITSAPDTVGVGRNVNVSTSENIARFTMIRMSATTHTINTDLRFLEVPFSGSGGNYQLTMHSNNNVLLPGYWMLFALNSQGVPSEAKIFQVQNAPPVGPPSVSNPGEQNTALGSTVSLQISASDPNNTALSYSASGLPNGLSINGSTGLISGSPSAAGTFNVTVTVDDNSEGSDSVSFSWIVYDPNAPAPPVLTNPGNQSSTRGDNVNLTIVATDQDDDPLAYSATGLPNGLSINANSGLISGIVSTTGTFNVTVIVDDNSEGTDSVSFTWSIFDPTAAFLSANFDSGTDGFSYADDTFRNTSTPAYASGSRISSGGFSGGALEVLVGGVDSSDITSGMSGGWRYTFNVASPQPVSLSLKYNLSTVRGKYETDEYVEALLSIDGALIGQSPNSYLARIVGEGDDSPPESTGWRTFEVDLGTLSAGNHTLSVGGYNNKKTHDSEQGRVLFDDIELISAIVNSDPILDNIADQSNSVGDAVELTFGASDPDGDTLNFTISGAPSELTFEVSTGTIAGILSAAGTYATTVTVGDGNGGVDTSSFTWTVSPALPIAVDSINSSPQQQGTFVNYTASASGGTGTLRYKWLFGDNTPETAYSTSPSVSHTFSQPGRYIVTVTVTDDSGDEVVEQFYQAVYLPHTSSQPSRSTSIFLEERSGADRLWVVNPDNDTVSVFNTDNNNKLAEISVGNDPSAVAAGPNGRIWVTNQESASISIIDSSSLSVVDTVALAHGTMPYGIIFDAANNNAFVVLEATGHLLKLNSSNGNIIDSLAVGPNPRHLAMTADGSTIYISRFITPRLPGEETGTVQTNNGGGEVVVVNAESMSVIDTIVLSLETDSDGEASGRGVPNYLGAPVISPDGESAWIPSKQDNILRGSLRDGEDLNFEHTVRSISSRISLTDNSEDPIGRIDHDDSSLASAGLYGPYGNYLFVALETSREVAVVDSYQKAEIFRFDTGRAPQGLALSAEGQRLYVHNFMDRSVGVYDLSTLIEQGSEDVNLLTTYNTVANESLSAQILNGKQIFYDASDTRLTHDSYMSCASCHNDGGHDGRIWDFTDLGEGLRNTISLNGRGGPDHGRLHWSANFDEVHDFENQIRGLGGGTGLMSDSDFNATEDTLGAPKAGRSADLDALAAYVNSLTSVGNSPARDVNVTLTSDAAAGRIIFQENNCATCHGGDGFTDSPSNALHDIGTLKPSSGQRLGGNLPGIDTPTLRGLWATAPYLHDGSAATIAEAVQAHNGVALSGTELNQLAAYLNQIDDNEPAPIANTNVAPVLTNPGNQKSTVGESVNLTVSATDADGDSLSFSATGLPAGLTMNNAGVIAGTVTTPGSFNVTVTVDDGNGGSDNGTFAWTVNDVVAGCGPLSQEAEDAELAGAFVVGNDVAASGGSYIHVPEGTGNAGFGSASRVTFCFSVTTADTYQLIGGVYAPDGMSDSFFVTVDGLPASGYIWKPFRNTQYANSYVTDNGVSVELALSAGEHTVVVYLREDGTRLDKLTLEAVGSSANIPPTLTNPGSQINIMGDSVSLALSANDPDGDPLVFGASGLPTGLSLNSNVGQITGSPSVAGSYTVNLTVSDGRGGLDNVTFGWTINTDSAGCNGLIQEAEDGQLVGNFAVGSDPSASGGIYIHVPDGTGNAGFGSASRAIFCFNVTEADTYRLRGTISAPDGTSDSFFVTVDGLPANGYTWKTARSALYIDDYVTDNGADVNLPLTVGEHTIVIYLREDGTRLDKLTLEALGTGPANTPPVLSSPNNQSTAVGDSVSLSINASDADGDNLTFSASGLPGGLSLNANTGQISGSPTTVGSYTVNLTVSDGQGGSDSVTFSWIVTDNTAACGSLNQEAEDGQLFGDMVSAIDPAASGGSYIHVPEGTGNAGFGSASRAVYCFNVTEAGLYRLRGSVYAPDGTSDSFFVTVDGQPSNGYLWDTGLTAQYVDDYVNNRNGADPVELNLTAGEHTIVVYLREDGARLDTLSLESAVQSLGVLSARSINDTDIESRGILGFLTYIPGYGSEDAEADMGHLAVTLLDEATRGDSYHQSVTTDAQGRFFFDTMPTGSYVVTVEVDGQSFEEPVNASDEYMAQVNLGVDSDALTSQTENEAKTDIDQNRIFVPFLGFE